MTARPLHEWLQPYLNWRWDRRLVYTSLAHVRRASEADRKLLIAFNNYLLDDVALLDRTAQTGILSRVANVILPTANAQAKYDAVAMGAFDDEARSVLKTAKATPPNDCLLFHTMFDEFVHDSLAGFDQRKYELPGYWRYRKGYLGKADARIVSNDQAGKVDQAA